MQDLCWGTLTRLTVTDSAEETDSPDELVLPDFTAEELETQNQKLESGALCKEWNRRGREVFLLTSSWQL